MPEKKNYLYEYIDQQSPMERLRNRLCSVFSIVQLVGNPKAKGLLNEDVIRIANEDLDAVRDLLADIDTDYDFYEQQLKECRGDESI